MLGDCHVHMVLDGRDWKQALARHAQTPDIPFIRAALGTYQRLGYTYLRDGGDRWGAGAAARALASEYGIRYVTPLAPLCKAGHYGAFIGETFENLRQYAKLVSRRRSEGADFIKIMISGLMDFDRYGILTEEGLTAGEIKEMIHIAHSEGFSVMAHANGARVLEAAACSGVDSVEHGAYPDHEALQAMAENHVIWVPTLSTIGNLKGKGRFSEAAVCAILEQATEAVEKYHAMGGLVAPGTDAGAWAVEHGCATEETYLAAAGVDAAACAEGAKAIMEKF